MVLGWRLVGWLTVSESGRPRGPGRTISKGGGLRPPPFGRVSRASGAAQTQNKMLDDVFVAAIVSALFPDALKNIFNFSLGPPSLGGGSELSFA